MRIYRLIFSMVLFFCISLPIGAQENFTIDCAELQGNFFLHSQHTQDLWYLYPIDGGVTFVSTDFETATEISFEMPLQDIAVSPDARYIASNIPGDDDVPVRLVVANTVTGTIDYFDRPDEWSTLSHIQWLDNTHLAFVPRTSTDNDAGANIIVDVTDFSWGLQAWIDIPATFDTSIINGRSYHRQFSPDLAYVALISDYQFMVLNNTTGDILHARFDFYGAFIWQDSGNIALVDNMGWNLLMIDNSFSYDLLPMPYDEFMIFSPSLSTAQDAIAYKAIREPRFRPAYQEQLLVTDLTTGHTRDYCLDGKLSNPDGFDDNPLVFSDDGQFITFILSAFSSATGRQTTAFYVLHPELNDLYMIDDKHIPELYGWH